MRFIVNNVHNYSLTELLLAGQGEIEESYSHALLLL